MVTLKEIAKRCNVSIASVSKAMNHAPDISEETAKRIRKTARSMGYFPNAAARALKTKQSFNIGILVTENGRVGEMIGGSVHEHFAQLIGFFQHEVELNGYDVTYVTRNIGSTSMSYLEHCKYRNFDGAILAGVQFDDPQVTELANSDIPIVTIDHVFDYCNAVSLDNVNCMRDLVHHIYNKGHRKIAFIHGQNVAVTRYRLASFYRTCEELNIPVPNMYLKEAIYHDPESTARATKELLELKNRPTCILFPDDFAYIGGRDVIEDSGLKIPEDISVAGFDGIYLSQVFRPRLTTIKQDSERIGREAARLLVEAMKAPKAYIPKHLLIPGTLQDGESVRQL